MIRLLHIVMTLMLLGCVGWTQERWIYPPPILSPDDSAALVDARRLVTHRNYQAALEIYLRLADENAGTSLGAGALESARYAEVLSENRSGAELLRRRIIAEYPGSQYEVFARYSEVEEQTFNAGRQEKLLAYSEFLDELGAPRLEGIIAGQSDQAVLQILSFHPEIRYALANVYYSALHSLGDPEQAVNLAKFGRVAFGTVFDGNSDFTEALNGILIEWRGKEVGEEPSRPIVTIVSPAPNSSVGAQAVINFSLASGDYRKAQVNLTGLSIEIDGVQQILNASINSEIDDTLTENVDFEVLTVTLSPMLSVGAHTVEVAAHSGYGAPTPENSASASWSFTVTDPPQTQPP